MNLGAIAGGLFGGPIGAAVGGALFDTLTKPNSSNFDLPASAFRGRDGGDVNINGGACGCSGAGGHESPVELATSLLEMAQHAEDPQQKADLIKAAIELLGGETGAGAPGGSTTPAGGSAPSGGADAPAAGETHVTSYEGESLKNLLTASGGKGRIGEEDGGYGVAGGKAGAEIDPGERLTFTAPADAGPAQGATVLLGDLYNGGPDRGRQETGRIIAKDAEGNVVGVYDVQGQGPNHPGELSVRIDKPFATLEFESGGKGSDFTVKAVHVDHGSSGGCAPAPSTPAPSAPHCHEPATPPASGFDAPKTFSGDDLRPWLSAEGGTVEKGKNGYSVENGASGVDVVSGEIDRGQSLTFTVPPGQSANGGGEVTLNHLYRNGPDGRHVEQAKVTFYDENGRVVDEKIVQGTPDGTVSVGTDKQFARVEVQPIDDGAGRSSDNSDFTLGSVTVNPASGGAQPAGGSSGSEGPNQELLSLLGRMPAMIMETVEDPEQQSRLLDLVAGLTRSLAGSGAQAA